MSIAGTLRIRKAPRAGAAIAAEAAEPPKAVDDYVTRILKLVPSEAVAIYLIGRKIAEPEGALSGWALVVLALALILRAHATRPKTVQNSWYDGIQWMALIGAAISYVLWVHAIGDMLPLMGWLEAWMASLGVLIWALLIPILVTGDPADEG